MTVKITNADAGLASLNKESYATVELFSGDADTPTTTEVVSAALLATGLPAFSVVGFASGELVLAVTGGDAPVLPRGITTAEVIANATGDTVAVFRGGCFNPDALNWDVSYSTDAKKAVAFEGSKEAIFIKKPNYA